MYIYNCHLYDPLPEIQVTGYIKLVTVLSNDIGGQWAQGICEYSVSPDALGNEPNFAWALEEHSSSYNVITEIILDQGNGPAAKRITLNHSNRYGAQLFTGYLYVNKNPNPVPWDAATWQFNNWQQIASFAF